MKIGIMGCAHLHVHSYILALLKLNVEIVGITDQDLEEAKKIGKQYNIPLYEDEDALYNEDLNGVLICSDNVTHKHYAVKAAAKKMHVIVEKPIATTISDANEMIQACERNGVKLMVCFPVRYAPDVQQANDCIKSGAIGKIQTIVATNHGSMPGSFFIEKERSGGGAVIDHTVHVADILNVLMRSPVKEVTAFMDTLIHPIEVEDSGLLLIEFENGCVASLDTSWNRPASFPAWGDAIIDIHGEKGHVRIDAFRDYICVYSRDTPMKHDFLGEDLDYAMIKDFVEAIADDLPSPIPGEDGLYALQIALMAYQSHEKKGAVTR